MWLMSGNWWQTLARLMQNFPELRSRCKAVKQQVLHRLWEFLHDRVHPRLWENPLPPQPPPHRHHRQGLRTTFLRYLSQNLQSATTGRAGGMRKAP